MFSGIGRKEVSFWYAVLDIHFPFSLVTCADILTKFEKQFAAQKGCQPLKAWSAKWPLGLDFLIKVIRYGKAQQILKFFLDVIDESGTTFEQSLLGARGIDTVDPENIEAVLSTQFEGRLNQDEQVPLSEFAAADSSARVRDGTTGPTLLSSTREWYLHPGRASLETFA